jgi:hypothetical protein
VSHVLDLVENLAELFTWIGLLLGAGCFVAVLILRAARSGWVETDAVVVEENGSAQLRWMTTDGELHKRALHPDEQSIIADPDELHVHYHRRAPHRVRFEVIGHGEKVLRAIGFILVGLGVLSLIVSLVVLFVPRT